MSVGALIGDSVGSDVEGDKLGEWVDGEKVGAEVGVRLGREVVGVLVG